jgi:leucine dehydrogenase
MAVFDSKSFSHHEQILYCSDKESGLKAIIAVHDTTLGPALGGCRFWNYASDTEALDDVLRLSRGMTYKAAVAGLNLGGGKAVIIGDAKTQKNEGLLRAFGRYVNSLSGRYITAEDVNMSVKDIEHVGSETRFVTGVSSGSGDPSPVTALGVFVGIRACVKHALKEDSLEGVRVAVQGIGAVGGYLCQYLSHKGAKLYVADIDEKRVKNAVEKYQAKAVSLDDIHSLDVDVFAPCALGAILNDKTIPQVKAKIIAGAANNQLLEEAKHGKMLGERGILYAPDYVINAGGLINVYQELCGYNAEAARAKTEAIYDTLLEIFEIAGKESIPTHVASDRIAERRLQSVKAVADLRNTLGNQKWRPEMEL